MGSGILQRRTFDNLATKIPQINLVVRLASFWDSMRYLGGYSDNPVSVLGTLTGLKAINGLRKEEENWYSDNPVSVLGTLTGVKAIIVAVLPAG